MTSFIIKAQADRFATPTPWTSDHDCTFCSIISGERPAFRVYENEKVIAILDILPLRKGHTLVIPKAHYSRLSELPPELAAATGEAVSKVAHALTQALDNTALNVVCNQEYAQAVPHVHYHIIPAPTFGVASQPETAPSLSGIGNVINSPPSVKRMHQMEFESREELEDEDAVDLARKISSRL